MIEYLKEESQVPLARRSLVSNAASVSGSFASDHHAAGMTQGAAQQLIEGLLRRASASGIFIVLETDSAESWSPPTHQVAGGTSPHDESGTKSPSCRSVGVAAILFLAAVGLTTILGTGSLECGTT